MRRFLPLGFLRFVAFAFFFLISLSSNAQDMQVNINGGGIVADGSTVTLAAGNYMWFELTSVRNNCGNVKIKDITLSNNTDFVTGVYYNGNYDTLPVNLKASGCKNGIQIVYFYVLNITGNCSASTTVTVENNRDSPDFTFDFTMGTAPEIFVNGASFPNGDIYSGDTTTSSDTNTYFGVVAEGQTVTRSYVVSNIGSCPLDITGLSSTYVSGIGGAAGDFSVVPVLLVPPSYNLGTAQAPTVTVESLSYVVLIVSFTGPTGGTGTQTARIDISNSDNTTFSFNVSAEMFNEAIPGPGGITADFRLWLKSTRGIVKSGAIVTDWQDLGTNAKNATTDSGKEPTYLDTATDNINFNPVIKFENDGGSLEQYMYNDTNGFYSQDIFIVMVPDATMTSASSRNTIFGGLDSGSAGDETGIGFGDYSSEFTNETLSYNQDIPGTSSYNGTAEISSTYSKPGIINIRNNTAVSPTAQDILYNSNPLTTSTVTNSFANVNAGNGSKYWVGRNFDVQGSLNGRVAEIFTFAERVTDPDRQKIESYLAIKYGITLGTSTEAEKDYINSFDDVLWDVSANSGYNYHVAGIGRDSISDLNQKQSKTLNLTNEVSIGLGGVYSTNSANTNEFTKDGDFLVWGNNDGAFSGSSTNTVTIGSGITTNLTRIDRKWKIVETNSDGGDLGTVYVKIPSAAFSAFSKLSTEEYALIVADNPNFADGDIIDVIPLRSLDAGVTLQTWYNFDGDKYFTFGKVGNLAENHSVSIASGDYLVGEFSLNLNSNDFTISAWIKCAANASNRTVMAKGTKLQIRLNTSGNIEVYIDDDVTPKYISNMDVDDGKWHQTTFVYNSGTILMYVDGVLDHSEPDIVHPSPNFNHYAIGALYVDKGTVTNPLLGDIDEVYIWDVALTQNQIRYVMNQELERFDNAGTDYTNGKIIPQAATSNAIATIPWSNLRAYYNFNSFYGSTTEGQTNDRFFLRLNYLNKTKTILDTQTAPLPYISAADGAWDSGTTWSNSATQIIPNSLSLDGTTIIDWNIVELNHNITSGDRDISLLGLKSNSGTLTMADPIVTSPIENNSGQSLTITHYLELDGIIDLVGESQLIQTEGSIVDADSGGYIEKDQQGTANGFNYNYWSSSVGPIGGNSATRGTGISSTNSNYTIAGILNDGTNSGIYQPLLYNTSPNGSGTVPPPGFARTISTTWLYKFYGPADDYNAWVKISEASSLLAGEGFTMKGTGGTSLIPISTLQNYVFKGLPNNGDISLALDKTSGEVERLIGNPYPSAIDATEFILDNLSIADGGNNTTGTVINGALYFWDHFGQANSHVLKEYVGGYATRNLTGGAAAISNDIRINDNMATGTKIPGPYVAVNQGFFVSTVIDGFNDDNGTPIATVNGGNIEFKNSQRIYAPEDGSTSLFLKSSKAKASSKVVAKLPENTNPTIRLMYDSPLGYHRQIVLGANKHASNNFDIGYDAFMVDVNTEDMYWNLNNNKFVIQGVRDFNASQEYTLGLIVKQTGIARIKLEALENIATNIAVYIKDTQTNETFKINSSPFEINLAAGVYNDRFKLAFQSNQNKLLNVDEIVEESNQVVVYYDSKTSKLEIINNNHLKLQDISLFNILGQEIKSLKLNTSLNASLPVHVINGAYIVKLNTVDGLVTKKIIIE